MACYLRRCSEVNRSYHISKSDHWKANTHLVSLPYTVDGHEMEKEMDVSSQGTHQIRILHNDGRIWKRTETKHYIKQFRYESKSLI